MSRLAQAIDIPLWLRQDRASLDQRLQRDRTIGARCSNSDDRKQVLEWWRELPEAAPDAEHPGARIQRARSIATVVLLAASMFIGASVTGVALTYDGTYPINLLSLIAVTVVLPVALLVVNVVLLLARLWGAGTIGAGLSIGYWIGSWLDRALGNQTPIFVWPASRRRAGSRFATWQIVTWSQWMGTGFFLGAIAATVALVALTDLAFGWSTTLEISPASIAALVDALSTPWHVWLPDAAPSASAVADSRYFRIDSARRLQPAGDLGYWWTFYVMVLIVYGLLPRLIFLGVGLWRTRTSTIGLLLDDPEVTALLDRLRSPRQASGGERGVGELGGESRDSHQSGELGDSHEIEEVQDSQESLVAAPAIAHPGRSAAVIWNNAAETHSIATQMHLADTAVVALDVSRSAEEQDVLLKGFAGAVDADLLDVFVFTKGYEPPNGDFLDFLRCLRDSLDANVSIRVSLTGLAGQPPQQRDVRVWTRALANIDDPRLYVDGSIGDIQ